LSDQFDLTAYLHVDAVDSALRNKAPYFAGTVQKQLKEFGKAWLIEFERDLGRFFEGDIARLEKAVHGYIKFALDGMLLQKRFDKTGRYEPKTFDQAAQEVYLNADRVKEARAEEAAVKSELEALEEEYLGRGS